MRMSSLHSRKCRKINYVSSQPTYSDDKFEVPFDEYESKEHLEEVGDDDEDDENDEEEDEDEGDDVEDDENDDEGGEEDEEYDESDEVIERKISSDYQQRSFGERLTESAKRAEYLKTRQAKTTFKRANKNAPSEMSSKRPVRGVRQVLPVSQKHVRDPRFDSLCGKFNQDLFQKSYPFLNLAPKGPKHTLQEMKKAWRRSEMEKVAKGIKLKPYFPKISTLKMLSKVEQYKGLSDATLEKKLEKKRKKIKSRDTHRMQSVRERRSE